MTRRIDPEPITIFTAFMAAFSALVSALNYVKTHYRPLPTKVRANLMSLLADLDDHTKHLRADLSIIEDIFRNASFQHERTLRLGNSAHLTENDFYRYEKASDNVFRTLRTVHNISLKIERMATRFDGLEMATTTNTLGEIYTKLDQLLQYRELTLQKAWEDLRSIAQGLEQVIYELRNQLSTS